MEGVQVALSPRHSMIVYDHIPAYLNILFYCVSNFFGGHRATLIVHAYEHNNSRTGGGGGGEGRGDKNYSLMYSDLNQRS